MAMTAFAPAMTRDGETAGGIGLDDHRGRLIWPNLDLQVVAMKGQLYRFITRPNQLDHIAFGNPDRLPWCDYPAIFDPHFDCPL